MLEETKKKILKKIESLKLQFQEISTEIEKERMEENSSITHDLFDKREFVEQQIAELANSFTDQSKEMGEELGKEYQVEVNGAKRVITIVHQTEANPSAGKISAKSPLAQALMGHKPGDNVEVVTPAGPMSYQLF